MIAAAFAQKLGMTHVYDDAHRHVPVTILKVTPQVITDLITDDKNGYSAIQIGTVGRKHVAKPQSAELKQRNIDLPIAHRREVRTIDTSSEASPTVGTIIDATSFTPGDEVSISGTSKGKGFTGTIKRYGWSRGPETHGSKNVRKPGSIGSGYPQRVVPGKKLPGHMGHVNVTTKGHRIMAINVKDNTIAVSGPVPGAAKSRVFIQKLAK